MYYNTPLSEIMTKDLITLGPNDTLEVVDFIFNNNEFRHIPVINDAGRIIGIISKSDYFLLCSGMTLVNKEAGEKKNHRFFRTLLAEEVMKKDLVTLSPNTKVSVAAGIFKENLFHAIPIVDEDHTLMGMISTIDLLNYAYDQPAVNFK